MSRRTRVPWVLVYRQVDGHNAWRMQRLLVAAGLILVVVGLAWQHLARLPLGRLPGDLLIDRPGLKIWIPVTTMLLASAVLSLVLWLIRRF